MSPTSSVNHDDFEKRRLVSSDPYGDFKEFTENCMNEEIDEDKYEVLSEACSGYLGLGKNSGFKIVSLNVESTAPRIVTANVTSIGEQIVRALKYIIYVFIGICFIV